MSHTNIQSQRGGTLLGFVLGLVIGLIIALGVAMYVTKVPMPFSNKNQSRSADQDAVEAEKNKDWNPNGAIQSKPVTPEAPTDATAANPAAAAAAGAPNPGAAAAPAVTADPFSRFGQETKSELSTSSIHACSACACCIYTTTRGHATACQQSAVHQRSFHLFCTSRCL